MGGWVSYVNWEEKEKVEDKWEKKTCLHRWVGGWEETDLVGNSEEIRHHLHVIRDTQGEGVTPPTVPPFPIPEEENVLRCAGQGLQRRGGGGGGGRRGGGWALVLEHQVGGRGFLVQLGGGGGGGGVVVVVVDDHTRGVLEGESSNRGLERGLHLEEALGTVAERVPHLEEAHEVLD